MADQRRLIVTHHAPDLDAIVAVWLFKRFNAQEFASAQVAFVNPGETISETAALQIGHQADQAVHVDTGLGEFDHHQPERGRLPVSAASIVYDHLLEIYPDLSSDESLKTIVNFTVEIDHFQEIEWPEAANRRYNFMIQELIRGIEFTDPHNDESQLNFGFQCLDCAYAILTQQIKAESVIAEKGQSFQVKNWRCLALATRNDDTIKLAQKQGYQLVVRKDTQTGHIRIKARPDSDIELKPLYQAITKTDRQGTWYYHPSGKMLLNGSFKHRSQNPSPLGLDEIIKLMKETYE